MFRLRSGLLDRSRKVLPRALVLVVCVAAGGCSANSTAYSEWQFPGDSFQHVAEVVTPHRAADIEDDGLEAQVAPPRRSRTEPDDPSQPYSPNYGAGDRMRSQGTPAAPQPAIPKDLPPAQRRLAAAIVD